MAKNIRTFIAIALSDEIRRSAVGLQRALEEGEGEGSVKWVAPENIHLTLCFLGNVPDDEVPAVCNAAIRSVAEAAPFRMDVAGAGAFPTARRPRTIWLGVNTGAQEVVAIQAALEEALAPLGFRREKRKFRPHVTIGRVRGKAPGLAIELEQRRDWAAGSMLVEEVVVMASELGSDGPKYTVMGRAALAGG